VQLGCGHNNNFICIAPFKNRVYKSALTLTDKAKTEQLLRRQYNNRKQNRKVKQKQDMVMVKFKIKKQEDKKMQ